MGVLNANIERAPGLMVFSRVVQTMKQKPAMTTP